MHTEMLFTDIGVEVESPLSTSPLPMKSYHKFSISMRSSHTKDSSDCLAESQEQDLLAHCEYYSRI